MHPLLASFLDADGESCQWLLTEIRNREASGVATRLYEFNRFDITVDFGAAQVVLQDDLDVESSGEYKLSLVEFVEVLKKHCGQS